MAFSCTQEVSKYFEKHNVDTCTKTILLTPDFTKIFITKCDALENGIGVILCNKEGPFPLKFSNLKEKNLLKQIYEKEILAILHEINNGKPYLKGWYFKVRKHSDNIKYLLE